MLSSTLVLVVVGHVVQAAAACAGMSAIQCVATGRAEPERTVPELGRSAAVLCGSDPSLRPEPAATCLFESCRFSASAVVISMLSNTENTGNRFKRGHKTADWKLN